MGPIFYKKYMSKHGSVFVIEHKFSGVCWEHPEIVKNEQIFQEKSLKMGTFFSKNDP